MKRLIPLFALAFLIAPSAFAADHEHGGHEMKMEKHDDHAAMSDMFMATQKIDGYDVTFHIMPSDENMKSMGADSVMIKIEKEGKALTDLVVNTKVIFPDETDESKPTMPMGDWLMAGYDLQKEGRHQVMVLFKTADGKKHFGGVYYPH